MRLPTLFLAAVALAACTVDPEPVPPRWEAGPAGSWYKGDFHVHTSVGSNDTRTDGVASSWPTTVKDVAQQIGLDFVVITDHSNSAGGITTTTREDGRFWNRGPEFPVWDTAATLTDASFLMIDGSEISPVSTLNATECDHCPSTGSGELTPVGHVGCFPADLEDFDITGHFTDRPPGAVQGKQAIDECHERGGIAVVNHPYPKLTPWIEYDWTSLDYDAIEVWNGSVGYDMYDGAAYDAYLCDRLQGRKVVAVGGSDNHRTLIPFGTGAPNLDPPLGLPITSLLAPSLEWTTLTDAFKRGRIVVHDKDSFLEFRVFGDEGYKGTVGDDVELDDGDDELVFWLRGTSRVSQPLQLWHAKVCTDTRKPGSDVPPTVEKEAVYRVNVKGEFNHRVRLSVNGGQYFATLGAYQTDAKVNVRDLAITNVVSIRTHPDE